VKLKITPEVKGDLLTVRFSGAIDEDFAWADLKLQVGKELIVIIRAEQINSCGCREDRDALGESVTIGLVS
jgi:hypothetical protein